jgi:hypothetical protein
LLALLLALAPATGAEPLAWLSVEVIAFAHLDAPGLESEPGADALPDLIGALEPSEMPAEDGPGEGPHAYRSLPAQDLRLTEVVQRLRRSPHHRPLLHLGWTQPGGPREGTRPVHLQAGPPLRAAGGSPAAEAREAAGIDGTLRVYLAGQLHVAADVTLAPPTLFDPRPRLYRITEDRAVRPGEIHYLDHPAVGILVRITPYGAEPAGEAPPD